MTNTKGGGRMPYMSDSELVKSIRAGRILPCYLFWGRDAFTCEIITKKLIDKLVPDEAKDMNYRFFPAAGLSMSELADICEAMPMFTDRVVAAVNDLNADSLRPDETKRLFEIISGIDPATTTVIFYATGTDLAAGKKALSQKNKKLADHIVKCGGGVVEFAYKKPPELVGYIQSRLGKSGCFMSPDNAEYLAASQNCNILMINNECDKLTSYQQSGEIVRETIELLVSDGADTDAYKLSKAILTGKRAEAFDILQRLYSRQAEPIALLTVIAGAAMDIYRAKTAVASGVPEKTVVEDYSYRGRDFAVKNAFRDCRSMPMEKLRFCLKTLSDCDRAMKSKRTDPRVMLEEAIAKIIEFKG